MGHALLWIELLAANLLQLAFLLACLGRLKRRWLRIGLGVLVYLILILPPLGLTGMLVWWTYHHRMENLLLYHTGSLALCFFIGAIWLWGRAFRRTGDPDRPIRAAGWPRLRLLGAWGAATAVLLVTFFTLDFLIQRWQVALRQEAAELAQSVAPPALPEEENAAVLYRQAFELMGPAEEFDAWPRIWQEALDAPLKEGGPDPNEEPPLVFDDFEWVEEEQAPFDFANPELGEFLREQETTLNLLHAAAQLPGSNFENDYSDVDTFLSPQLKYNYQTVRLLHIDAMHKAALGDRAGAMRDLNTALQFSNHASLESTTLRGLVSTALRGQSTLTIEAILAEGPVEEGDLELPALASTPDGREMFGRALVGEKAYTLSLLSGDAVETGMGGKSVSITASVPYRVLFLPGDVKLMRESLDKMQRIFTLPYDEGHATAEDIENNLRFSMVTYRILPVFRATLTAGQRGDAYNRCLELALAIYRYQARHQRMPETLEELMPEFLPAIPLDPFDGEQLRVKREEDRWVVYSLGIDGNDDDGTPPHPDDYREGDITFEVARWVFPEDDSADESP